MQEKNTESLEDLKYWMNRYHDNWIECHNHLNAIRRILRKDISDLEKINVIKEIVDLDNPNFKIIPS